MKTFILGSSPVPESPFTITSAVVSNLQVIGKLSDSGLFVVRLQNGLYVVDQLKVKELLMFHKLMHEKELSLEELQNPIRLNEVQVGIDCWAVATSNSEEYLFFGNLPFTVNNIQRYYDVVVLNYGK